LGESFANKKGIEMKMARTFSKSCFAFFKELAIVTAKSPGYLGGI
jgi:hypothetical protein